MSLKYQDTGERVATGFEAANLASARGGYIGLRQPIESKHMTLAEAKAKGFKVVPWDGECVESTST